MDGRITLAQKPQKQKVEKAGDKLKPVDVLNFDTSPVAKDYVPEGFDTVEDFLKDMREEYDLDFDFDRENRDEALEDKKFAAGQQWETVVLEDRKGLH